MGKTTYTISTDEPTKSAKTTLDANAQMEVVDHQIELRPKVSSFRRILPQVLASTAKNLLLLDLGMAAALPTIVIPALRGLKNRAPDEFLNFSPVQASWFGSIAYICQPVGSVLSGIVLEPLGRKKSMILVNIPHIIAWLMLYFAGSLEEMYIAAVLLGLGIGFMEAPVVTYVGEICEPSIRGILTSCAGVAVMFGFFLVYLLGTLTTWRMAAAICCTVPVFTMIAICFVPETPLWLLSKGRKAEALKSLQWLRGWVPPQAVEKEFVEIQRYSENSNKCTKCQKADIPCTHPPESPLMLFKELLRKRTIKPFLLVIIFFAIGQFSGLPAMRPYLVQIFQTFGFPVDSSWATVIIGIMGLAANIVCMSVIKFIGKRRLSIISMAGTCICCMSLGIYAINVLPSGWSSFDKHEMLATPSGLAYLPMILFFGLAFFTSVGIASVPWMLLSEVFPFKSRGIASGVTAGLNYTMGFITTKTYFNLETSLSLAGVILLYGVIDCLGFLYIFYFLPETERRTLEDIEIHFSDNKRKLTDIKIKKQGAVSEQTNNNGMITVKPAASNGCVNNAFTEH